jgi:hypothetical protein
VIGVFLANWLLPVTIYYVRGIDKIEMTIAPDGKTLRPIPALGRPADVLPSAAKR